jgi:hypothetical protein
LLERRWFGAGESSLFNEWGDPLTDYALADLFGAHLNDFADTLAEKKLIRGTNTLHTYLRILPELRGRVDGPENGTEPQITGNRHRILSGFDETDILFRRASSIRQNQD